MAFIYLASPYTHKRATLRHERYMKVAEVTAQLLKRSIFVYSPIVHCHEIAREHKLPTDIDYWKKYNRAMLEEAAALWVLQLPNWEKSEGIRYEILIANTIKIPVKMISFPLKELP